MSTRCQVKVTDGVDINAEDAEKVERGGNYKALPL